MREGTRGLYGVMHVFNSCGEPLPDGFQRAMEIRVVAGFPSRAGMLPRVLCLLLSSDKFHIFLRGCRTVALSFI